MGRRSGWNREMRISSVLRWITEYLFCLRYNGADLFLGLSVFGVKNRLLARSIFSHNTYSVLLLQPIQFSVLKTQTLGERFQRPALSVK